MQLQDFDLMTSGRKQNRTHEATEVGQSGRGRACVKPRGIRSEHGWASIIINLYIFKLKKTHTRLCEFYSFSLDLYFVKSGTSETQSLLFP
jgi:hypothetical protein